jgi:ABC-type uncharacterized transport system permease subunit
MSWITANILVTCLAYLVSTSFYMVYLMRNQDRLRVVGYRALLVASGLHAIAVVHLLASSGTKPLVTVATLIVSLVGVAAFLLAARKVKHRFYGAFVAPVVAVVLFSVWVGVQQVAPATSPVISVLSPIHIASSVLGILAFAVASGASALYMAQEYQLRNKRLADVMASGFPPQVTLERIATQSIAVGFPFYTLGIVLGAMWSFRDGPGSVSIQYILAVASWVLYAVVLTGRLRVGMRGRQAAVLTILGFLGALSVLLIYLARSA